MLFNGAVRDVGNQAGGVEQLDKRHEMSDFEGRSVHG